MSILQNFFWGIIIIKQKDEEPFTKTIYLITYVRHNT